MAATGLLNSLVFKGETLSSPTTDCALKRILLKNFDEGVVSQVEHDPLPGNRKSPEVRRLACCPTERRRLPKGRKRPTHLHPSFRLLRTRLARFAPQ